VATVWVYRIFLAVAVPSLALLATSVGTQLPYAMSTQDADLPGLLAWAAATAIGALLVMAAVVLRWRGRTGMAATLLGIVAMPAIVGVGLALFIVLLFILKQ
jgi:hypothetical protein